ncbi:hypothetical protein M1M85_00225 [Nitrospinaceae bacterium]|nr:hypothetical protein [Nitrospinaceae bacterium]
MAKTEEYLSQSKYAEHRNVTKDYIGRLIKEGRLHLIKGKLNVEMSDAELDNKSNDDKAPNYWREKALHEKAKRELAELDLKLKHDQLVEVDQFPQLPDVLSLLEALESSRYRNALVPISIAHSKASLPSEMGQKIFSKFFNENIKNYLGTSDN